VEFLLRMQNPSAGESVVFIKLSTNHFTKDRNLFGRSTRSTETLHVEETPILSNGHWRVWVFKDWIQAISQQNTLKTTRRRDDRKCFIDRSRPLGILRRGLKLVRCGSECRHLYIVVETCHCLSLTDYW
jgi:hypothetical protein